VPCLPAKNVSGGASKIIHLCDVDAISLHSSWMPALKASEILFIRYYCIKKNTRVIKTFKDDSLFLQKIEYWEAIE